ncbi:hypothetical protein BU24DRAFT_368443 [Aaosphaeria arxii CBS 175.79]|uniref:MutL C-terminal dimerisation domain-containing protein n=1 Tax=Aaosphaeria arxii CBS 175.79 TaxID=1450172 RepID=A0A6A5XZI0_9PLEO|nr:uncharacterized protein BU24DRAFT_368443 [Aaosphaeria arxii CBS 175.79]KAF2018131.1 hypothetical protein BU24DRAFT_368443 [Aaosphaeria arxii CBS 175.79]
MFKHHDSRGAASPAIRGRSILPLPDEAIAQIKSSTAITSLNGVVLDLLKNAFDARATRIEVTVDWARGSCTVEDDGLGIAPLEFADGGGLGKLYYTSKYSSQEVYLGRHGTFLASLAALSLLAITSHHHEYRSHNSVTFHHSKVIERQTPVATYNEIASKGHGTRVTVRNLFGNLPVRVKQRAVAVEQKTEHDRLRETLKQDVTGLLLAWQGTVRLRVRDANNTVILNTNAQHPSKSLLPEKTSATQLQHVLHVLTQLDFISTDNWSTWVPASAATSDISIKGAVSLIPAPSKRVQFISLGVNHISPLSSHNELYDTVNRIFNLSNFGMLDDETDLDESEKLRRKTDGRFKSDGPTQRQLRGKKGVDRYPMFCLCISFGRSSSPAHLGGELFNDTANLQAVIEVLEILLTQWLSSHHFRPQKTRSRRQRKEPSEPDREGPVDFCNASLGKASPSSDKSLTIFPQESPREPPPKRKRLTSMPAKSRQSMFMDWSRIKTGKPEFLESMSKANNRKSSTPPLRSLPLEIIPRLNSTKPSAEVAGLTPTPSNDSLDACSTPRAQVDRNTEDDTIVWTDPLTKQTHLLNARTGCAAVQATSAPPKVSARLAISSHEDGQEIHTPFLDGILQTWTNPIFKPTESPIPRFQSIDADVHVAQSAHAQCAHFDFANTFRSQDGWRTDRLSKTGLYQCRVLGQVDRKFILVEMPGFSACDEGRTDTRLLVLVDQHAADERIRVETLLAELCAPLQQPINGTVYTSKLGYSSKVASMMLQKPLLFSVSPTESDLFIKHAARFAAWGVLYDVSVGHSIVKGNQASLVVTALPPSIAERCRLDPKVLISFLRTSVWTYAEDLHLPTLADVDPSTQEDEDEAHTPLWVRRLSHCPQALVDMINSRACRSAIMFNDELLKHDCEELVTKLSKCTFPFMCAHGRPSMVPLVDLNNFGYDHQIGPSSTGTTQCGSVQGRSDDFVSAWKKWKQK